MQFLEPQGNDTGATLEENCVGGRRKYRMRFSPVLFGLLFLLSAPASFADVSNLQNYIPEATSFAAQYVVIEGDPKFDEHRQRIQAAREKQYDWLLAYATTHRGQDPLPYHPNFGVPESDYIRFQSPINHYREVSRQQIRVDKQVTGTVIELSFHGKNLFFDKLLIDTETPTIVTPRDTIVFRSVVDLERASLPPGRHQGVSFNTADDKIRATRSRESILIGALKGTSTGIIHYSFKSEHGIDRAYVTFSIEE